MPVLAVEGCGAILFANKAIADLLGYRKASILKMTLERIIPDLPAEESVLPFLRTHSEQIVGLIHAKGRIIEARMSASAMVRQDDQIVLAGFLYPHNNWLATA
jgi:PAS domain S-box-containing protein